MKLPNSYFILIQYLLTVQDKRILFDRLDTVSSKTFQVGANIASEIEKTFPYDQAQAVTVALQDLGCDFKNPASFNPAIATLNDSVRKIPELIVHTAIPLRRDFLRTLSDQISRTMSQKVVFDTHVAESLVAGAIFEFNGRYFDASFQKKMREIRGIGEIGGNRG